MCLFWFKSCYTNKINCYNNFIIVEMPVSYRLKKINYKMRLCPTTTKNKDIMKML